MSKPRLTAIQKKAFETKFRELVKHEKAKESIASWDGMISWDLLSTLDFFGECI